MSMNLYGTVSIPSTRQTKARKNKHIMEVIGLPFYQTPTNVTFQILKSDDPLEAYFEWLESWIWDEELIENHKREVHRLISTAVFQGGSYQITWG